MKVKKIGESCAWRGWNILSVKCWQDVMLLKVLHIHLYSKKKIESIKKTWFQMTSEWLVKYRKIDIWVEAHVGSSSCTSTRTSVILNNTGTSFSSHITKPHTPFCAQGNQDHTGWFCFYCNASAKIMQERKCVHPKPFFKTMPFGNFAFAYQSSMKRRTI